MHPVAESIHRSRRMAPHAKLSRQVVFYRVKIGIDLKTFVPQVRMLKV